MPRLLPRILFVITLSIISLASPRAAQAPPTPRAASGSQPPARMPSIDERTTGMQKLDGYFPLYWDERTGSLWLEIRKFDTELLYSHRAARRPRLERHRPRSRQRRPGARSCTFQRVGPRVLMVQPNYIVPRRAAPTRDERKSVEDSFAKSILWGFTVAAESERPRARRRDRLLPARRRTTPAARCGPGTYRVDRTRSAFYLPRTKAFPEEHRDRHDADVRQRRRRRRGGGGGGGPAQGPPPGRSGAGRAAAAAGSAAGMFSGTVASVTPTRRSGDAARAHSFVELPDGNYKPRYDDPRAGYGGLQLRRLQRADRRADGAALHPPPSPREEGSRRARVSEPVKPIQYWVDSRRAGDDPARRCSKARAGGTRRSRPPASATPSRSSVLPDGADPMDIRYNMINWVHRSTRGWSSGGIGRRSAHRRDHQGDGHARLAARSAGLPDLRGPARRRTRPAPRSRRSCTRRRSRASASSPRTRSATRSASATTTTTAPRAGSR